MKRASLFGSLVSVVAIAAGCSSSGPTDSQAAAVNADTGPLCVALRGNGHYVITHFNALARIHELYGKIDTIAGGSSSTVTMFAYESMRMNPTVKQCETGACSSDQEAKRLALMLKSVRGYAEAVGLTDGIIGESGVLPLIQELQTQGVQGLLQSDPREAARRLQTILEPATLHRLGVLANPELLSLLRTQKDAGEAIDSGAPEGVEAARARLVFANQEIHDAISTFGHFSAASNRIFFRPGLLSFEDIAETTFARAGDFYAGKDGATDGALDSAGLKVFLDSCAERAVGLPWRDPNPAVADADKKDIQHLPMGGAFEGTPTTCADFFKATAVQSLHYMESHPNIQTRVEDVIGRAVNTIAVTSVLTGPSVGLYKTALETYQSGTVPSPQSVPFAPNWADLKIGYWGRATTLDRLLAAADSTRDAKTAKTISLGVTQWKEILKRSPAEPGLSRAVPIDDEKLSLGGWPDLAPVLALKNAGCERTIYVTRTQPESPFAIGIAKLLGMSEADQTSLYDLGNPDSSFSKSLSESTAVMCTDWNSFKDMEQDEMAVETYKAPIETKDAFFSKPGANVTERTGKVGCTAGVK